MERIDQSVFDNRLEYDSIIVWETNLSQVPNNDTNLVDQYRLKLGLVKHCDTWERLSNQGLDNGEVQPDHNCLLQGYVLRKKYWAGQVSTYVNTLDFYEY